MNFPCEECGHSKQIHSIADDHTYLNWLPCLNRNNIDGMISDLCKCSKYVPSNLKYLEQLYDQKVKTKI